MSDPEIIYLQSEESDCGRTWCEDCINDDDVPYIRADLLGRVSVHGINKSVFTVTLGEDEHLKKLLIKAFGK